MLAGIDETTGHRILKRGRPTTDTTTRLEHGHTDVGRGERGRRRQAGQTATNDDDMRPVGAG